MEKIVLLSCALTFLYGLVKIIEMKFVDQKWKPLKDIIRDLVFVFSCGFVVFYVFIKYQRNVDDFFSVVTNTNILNPVNIEVFTGNPDF